MALKLYPVFSIVILLVICQAVTSRRLPHETTQHDNDRMHHVQPKLETSYLLKPLLKRITRSLYNTATSGLSNQFHTKSEELRMPNCSKQMIKANHQSTANKESNNKSSTSCSAATEKDEGVECMAEEFCEDAETPIGRVWHCKTRMTLKEICVPNPFEGGYKKIRVLVKDGCDCRLGWKR